MTPGFHRFPKQPQRLQPDGLDFRSKMRAAKRDSWRPPAPVTRKPAVARCPARSAKTRVETSRFVGAGRRPRQMPAGANTPKRRWSDAQMVSWQKTFPRTNRTQAAAGKTAGERRGAAPSSPTPKHDDRKQQHPVNARIHAADRSAAGPGSQRADGLTGQTGANAQNQPGAGFVASAGSRCGHRPTP